MSRAFGQRLDDADGERIEGFLDRMAVPELVGQVVATAPRGDGSVEPPGNP